MELIDPLLPATDREVREGLRLLESPVVLFAETAAERRTRLRTAMIEKSFATLHDIRTATGHTATATATTTTVPRRAPVTRAPHTRETFSPASSALVQRRLELLPRTLSRAERRVSSLKSAFLASDETVRPAHAAAIEKLRHMRLVRSVRNVKVAPATGDTHTGMLCLPFVCCAAVPAVPHCAVTGAVDGIATVWDTSRCAARDSAAIGAGRWGRVQHLSAHPTAPLVFGAVMFDERITAWRIAGEGEREAGSGIAQVGETKALEKFHTARVHRLAVDANGVLLASTSEDATVCLWDITTLTPSGHLSHLHTQDGYETAGATLDVTFHPDGSLLSTTDRAGRVVTWDVRSGKLAFATAGAFGGHMSACTCVSWLPCGVRFATGGADNAVHLWDARYLYRAASDPHAQEQVPCILTGHTDVITSVSAFANPFFPVLPAAVVSTSLDGTVRVWDADRPGACVRVLAGALPVRAQCRPSGDAPGVAGDALMTIAHGKYWSMWDSVAAGEAFEVICKETETTAVAYRPLQFHSSAAGAMDNGDDKGEEKYSGGSDDSDDEMAVLRNGKAKTADTKVEADRVSSLLESSDDEDEMSFLKKKKK